MQNTKGGSMNKIETKGVRYLGSKSKIIPLIIDVVESLNLKDRSMIDVFTGTTRVAQAFKSVGYEVTTSDLAWASEAYSNAFICNDGNTEHLQKHIDTLNAIQPKAGWLTKNYCDGSAVKRDGSTIAIQVWKQKNGKKADAIRDHIDTMNLKEWEKMYLITSLIFALDKVDNTVGLQQAYLKGWKSPRVDKDLTLEMLPKFAGKKGKHITGDALKIKYSNASVAYLDPPYTSADYSTYYHIWDSITKWDKPEVGLSTNRRVDRVKSSDKRDMAMASPWYSKKTALEATKKLIERLPVKYCVFSYSDEGLISYDDMESLCKQYKSYKFYQQQHQRHVMGGIGAGAKEKYSKKNTEYVILIEK